MGDIQSPTDRMTPEPHLPFRATLTEVELAQNARSETRYPSRR
jgi:hypothetical protein